MSTKYSINDVRNIFNVENYILLSDKYINTKTKLKYRCPNGHKGSMNLNNFLYCGRRCPVCSGNKKHDLEYVRSEFFNVGYILLSKEYTNAKTPLKYRCSKRHTHSMTWGKFKQGRRCPYCSHRKFTGEHSLSFNHPRLVDEWDYYKNKGLVPENVFSCANKKVWWRCHLCDYGWESTINNRTNKGAKRGCPACANIVVTDKNNLEKLFPLVASEWDSVKNKGLLPSEVVFGSNRKVWWACHVCNYGWAARVSDRTRKTQTYNGKRKRANGCPACAGQVVTEIDNLLEKNPDLCLEWDYKLNGSLLPNHLRLYSNIKVWWRCSVCSYSWESYIYNRTKLCSGCPLCARKPVSKISQKWLDTLDIKIREYYIKELKFRVDGFDPKTNTVYEFLGDYWHGNPKVYLAAGINPTSKKSYGELHRKTLDRFRLLEKEGFKVIYIWEKDFNNERLQTW